MKGITISLANVYRRYAEMRVARVDNLQKLERDNTAPPRRITLPSLSCSRCFESFENASDLRNHFREAHGTLASSAHEDGGKDGEDDGEEEEDDDDDHVFDELEDREESIDSDGGGSGSGGNSDERITFGSVFSVFKPYVAIVLQEANWICSCHSSLLDSKALNEFGIDEPGKPFVISINDLIQPGELWLTILYRGGFFAGIITEMSPPSDVEEGDKIRSIDEFPKIRLHKRFARYTTRRSQGGSQSAHDASSGKANSMGAQLRRHNERALVTDIHTLLQSPEWSYAVPRCRRIFISAAKTTIGELFDGSSLKRGDPRIKNVPFTSGRPSIDEALRVTKELAKITWIEEYNPSLLLNKPSSTVVVSKPSLHIEMRSHPHKEVQNNVVINEKAQNAPLKVESVRAQSDTLPPTNLSIEKEEDLATSLRRPSRKIKNKSKPKASTNSRAPIDNASNDDDEFLESAMAAVALESEERKAMQEMDEIRSILLNNLNEGIRRNSFLCRIPQVALSIALGLTNRESSPTSLFIEAKEKLEALSSLLSSGLKPSEVFTALEWSSLAAASVAQEAGFSVDWDSMTKLDGNERSRKVVQLQKHSDNVESILVKGSRSVETKQREVIAPSVNRVSPSDDLVLGAVSEREQKRLAMLRAAERRAHAASGASP